MKLCKKRIKLKFMAFTMAEAILVMTILGIIATIMITTLKPAQFKDKGLEIMARKVLSEIDTAITQILINNTKGEYGLNDMDYADLALSDCRLAFRGDCASGFVVLLKKYLTTTRQEVSNTSYCKTNNAQSFYLKDGACVGYFAVGVGEGTAETIFPGETTPANVIVGTLNSQAGAILYIDTNGDEEPNIVGKDQFAWPIGRNGIMYDED